MIKKLLQVILVSLSVQNLAKAQTTVIFQPDSVAGIDALIKSDYVSAGTNFGNDPEFDAVAWKVSGTNVIIRSLLKFDLSSIPATNGIFNTVFTLFFDSAAVYGAGFHSGANSFCIRRITSPWQENTVTWNNQPATSTTDQFIWSSGTSNSAFSITGATGFFTNWVAGWVANPSSNYGIMIQLNLEVPNACRLICFK